MKNRERLIIIVFLTFIALLVGYDIYTDSREGTAFAHVIMESFIAVSAILGIFYLLRGMVLLKSRLHREISDFSNFKKEAEEWRSQARRYTEGLSHAIENQLTKWKLSPAEKEIAFLLLKGLSLKEISDLRQTSEKTTRTQAMSIYAKAGISGRTELSAFFLEDLFTPTQLPNQSQSTNSI